MSSHLESLNPLWEMISVCLRRLTMVDVHAALALQPAAEAFFLVHGSMLASLDQSKISEHPDAQKLLHFAGKFGNGVYLAAASATVSRTSMRRNKLGIIICRKTSGCDQSSATTKQW